MLTNIEDNKKVYDIEFISNFSNYSLMIFEEPEEKVFRIINLTLGIIYKQVFYSFEEAENMIFHYQSLDEVKILDIHSLCI